MFDTSQFVTQDPATDAAAIADSSKDHATSGLIIVNPKRAHNVSDITRIVNYAVGRMYRYWGLSEAEVDDLRQEGYIAAIEADKTYDPRRAAWSTWILRRVQGQLKTSIGRLRNCGMTGNTPAVVYTAELDEPEASVDIPGIWDNDEPLAPEQLTFTGQAPDDAADIDSTMEALAGCLSERSRQVLTRYYGLDGARTGSVADLGHSLGFSKKHAFTLLQRGLEEARMCLQSRNS